MLPNYFTIPFYLFQVSMVLSAWKMAPLLRSKNCALPKILILLLDVSTCQNLCIPPPLHIQKVLWHNKQIGKTIVCRCAILSFISRQTTKMRHNTVFQNGKNGLNRFRFLGFLNIFWIFFYFLDLDFKKYLKFLLEFCVFFWEF